MNRRGRYSSIATDFRRTLAPIAGAAFVGVFGFLLRSVASAADVAPAYPLKVSDNHRHLVDQKGNPFLIIGDAPQSLTANLSDAEAEKYFADRESHGFNSLWINLVCNDYTGGRPDGSTRDGILPFSAYLPDHKGDAKFYDLSKPNEAFFSRCDAMLKAAARHRLLVFLDPIETGGWLSIKEPGVLLHNGPDACRDYGRFVAARYKDFSNVIWLHGNDFQTWRDDKSDAVATAVAMGIRDKDPDRLQTVELDFTVSSSADDPQWDRIVNLNAAYTYCPTYAQVLKDYQRPRIRPVFLIEANYEFEALQGPVTTAPILRKQEYWAMLSGAAGQMYGNHYTWTFENDWQKFLDTPGAKQMIHFKEFFESHRWFDLVPDADHTVVTSGYGKFSSEGHVADNDYLVAARTSDGAMVLAYTPVARKFTVDLSKLHAPATAKWFDPTNGKYADVNGPPLPNSGTREFTTPGKNGDGESDWMLVLEANSAPPPH